jgi:hypothetical protein
MRWITYPILILIVLVSCQSQPSVQNKFFYWWHYENIPRDSTGKLIGVSNWDVPHKLPSGDTFVLYKNYDSIRMVMPGIPDGDIFRKVEIHSSRWKPRPEYDALLLLGTYERQGLDGLFFSFYATKDLTSIMQVVYTNPGNLNGVAIFSKDSVNILQKKGMIIDPKDELVEPERVPQSNP